MGDIIQFKQRQRPVVPEEAHQLVFEAYEHLVTANILMDKAEAIADAAGVPKPDRTFFPPMGAA